MEITRELQLDADADEVWALLTDVDELAAWVGDEVRGARLLPGRDGARTLEWTWAPDGIESEVRVELETTVDGTRVTVTERTVTGGARACAVSDAWDDRLFGLEVRCLARTHALARI